MGDHSEYIRLAMEAARKSMREGFGGPFGATVVRNGEVIAVAANSVLASHDPTAHAEVCAIRQACEKLETHDLFGCVIYATGEPCPMCLSAIIWANIDTCYYYSPACDAEEAGFRDSHIYRHIRGEGDMLELIRLEKLSEPSLYDEYRALQGQTY